MNRLLQSNWAPHQNNWARYKERALLRATESGREQGSFLSNDNP
jgi:hypothetical protein